MCGRYASSADPDLLTEEFEIDEIDDDLPGASFNVAPTDPVPAVLERVRDEGVVRRLRALRWGLVPSWAKDTSIGSRMINARLESVAEKPSYRKAFAARRCLLPADGYYEWYDTGRTGAKGKPVKQPYFIHRADDGLLAMAGLYEFWKDPKLDGDEAWWLSCTVITTEATDAAGRIHDRMPMVIDRSQWDAWLDPARTDADDALELLQVTEPAMLAAYPVSTQVNSVRNNGPELLDRVAEVES
ncbi:SOS response-associated peptidase [Propionibacteriaceae bacterium Y2011]|uniref:SOS response-associated peptidase n=1 Tax=Microlunatus sp. Y2014 TaxID=3418488 RepID=UPI003B4B928E